MSRLRAKGCDVDLRVTRCAGDAEQIAREVSGEAFDLVVVAGGDGTINEVVNGLGVRQHPLGLIPMGTANVLAAELGYPESPDGVAELLRRGGTRRIFVGNASGRRFVMMAGIGFDAHVVANISPAVKRRLGKGAYVWQSLVEFLRHRPQRYALSIDGADYTAASAILANGHFYAGRFVCAPEARLDEPRFHVCIFGRGGRIAVIRYSMALLLGRLGKLADVTVIPATHVHVANADGEPVQGDGDIVATLPAEFRLDAEELEIVAP